MSTPRPKASKQTPLWVTWKLSGPPGNPLWVAPGPRRATPCGSRRQTLGPGNPSFGSHRKTTRIFENDYYYIYIYIHIHTFYIFSLDFE